MNCSTYLGSWREDLRNYCGRNSRSRVRWTLRHRFVARRTRTTFDDWEGICIDVNGNVGKNRMYTLKERPPPKGDLFSVESFRTGTYDPQHPSVLEHELGNVRKTQLVTCAVAWVGMR